jgi:dTDP-4-amino-4,6-dideoxygalactose transaminase
MAAPLAIDGGSPIRDRPFPPQQTVGEEERKAVLEVLDSGVLSQFLGEWSEDFLGGPKVKACEQAFAERFGAAEAISVNSATTGLQVAVAAVGIEPGDEVIVSPFTMSASAAAVVLHNAIPVFADIEPATYGLDPEAVRRAITPRTRAVLVTHLFGHPARVGELLDIVRAHDLRLIEDAAQSIGATWQGRETGTIGTAGVLSLNYHKIIHSGEGGIVFTDDERVAQIARLSRNHGEAVVDLVGLEDISNTVGSNYRLGEIHAAIAIEQLKKLDGLLADRRRLADVLTGRLRELPGISPPVVAQDCSHSYYVYPVRLDLDVFEGVTRPAFARALEAEGIPVSEGYVRPLYLQAMYQQRISRGRNGCPWTCGHWEGEVSYDPGICPVAERLHDSDLLLLDVCRAPLETRDVEDVADAFEKVVENLDALRAIEVS